jgi:hypothetical protein
MQQNQKDGAQPEMLQNIRVSLVPRFPGKKFRTAGNLCRISFSPDERPSNKKRPGKPGRSLYLNA